MKRSLSTLALTLVLASLARADVNKDSTSDQILDALDAAGRDLKAFSADVQLIDQNLSLGDDPNISTGRIWLERKEDGDTRVRLTFDKTQRGNRITPARRDILLDAGKLIDRDWSTDPKKQSTRNIGEPGKKLDLFKLGQGPFPLPVGQSRESVLKQFDVKQIESPNAVVELTPKKGSAFERDFKRITVTVGPDGWPHEIETENVNQTELRKAVLKNVQVNAAVKPDAFDLEPIDEKVWNVVGPEDQK